MLKKYFHEVDEFLYTFLVKRAPALSPKRMGFLVSVTPWLVLFSSFIFLPTLLSAFGIMSRFDQTAFKTIVHKLGSAYYVWIFFVIVDIALKLMAFWRLKQKEKTGWNLTFFLVLADAIIS